jgi:hypothetical protein
MASPSTADDAASLGFGVHYRQAPDLLVPVVLSADVIVPSALNGRAFFAGNC